MKPAGVYVCPKCGHKPLGGEDVDTDTGRKLKKLGKNQHLSTKAEKQAWWSQIKFYQRQRVSQGKLVSHGWCAHTFREKFGEWPDNLSDFPMEITPEVSNYIRYKLIRFAKGQKRPPQPQTESHHAGALPPGCAAIYELPEPDRPLRQLSTPNSNFRKM